MRTGSIETSTTSETSAKILQKNKFNLHFERYGNAPGAYMAELLLGVPVTGLLTDALDRGAPETPNAVRTILNREHKLFASQGYGKVSKHVTLLCCGTFLTQRKGERARNRYLETGWKDAELRTILAFGEHYAQFCTAFNLQSMRLVCLASKLRQYEYDHVPVLRQSVVADKVCNSIAFEPYQLGWAADHVFVFEKSI